MRKLLSVIAILSLVIVINSCKKDSTSSNTLEKGYFTIQDATFVSGNMPASSPDAPAITNAYGNPQVLAGGSNPISLVTNSDAAFVLVGVQGQSGYYKVPATALKSTNSVYLVYLLFSQNLTSQGFTIVVTVMDSNGLVSESWTVSVTAVTAGTGKLQVSISWDKQNDVDLHMIEPNGEEIYYGNSFSENGGDLDVDSNPMCILDYINNENITYDESSIIEAGKYTVLADLYSDCEIANNTNYIVTARYNGVLIQTASGTNPYHGTFVPTDEDNGSKEVMTFNIAASKAASMDKSLYFVFHNPKQNRVLSPQKVEMSKK